MMLATLTLLLGLASAAHAAPKAASPLKVFVLAGQSNMEGQAEVRSAKTGGTHPHIHVPSQPPYHRITQDLVANMPHVYSLY